MAAAGTGQTPGLLSQSDKLTRTERASTLASTRAALDQAAMSSEVMLFSSKSAEGVAETRALLEGWLRTPQ